MSPTYWPLAVGMICLLGGWFGARRCARVAHRWGKRMLATMVGFLFLAAGGLLGSSGYEFWFFHRTPPAPLHWQPFLGIVYDREVRRQPRPLVVHLVRTDLQAPGIECLVTPGDAVKDGEIRARTTSEFLEEFGLQVAINAGFFSPFYSNGPLDYYPHTGDPVNVEGLAMARGREYSESEPVRPTLFVTEDNRAVIGPWPDTPCQAVSGNVMLVEHGVSAGNLHTEPLWDERHPRTAAAVDRTGRILWLVVVDGRQPGYSEGVTLAELAEIIVAAGAETAVNLDGGGSSVLVMATPDGIAEQVSTPLTFRRWVGRERPVANHFGLYARRVTN